MFPWIFGLNAKLFHAEIVSGKLEKVVVMLIFMAFMSINIQMNQNRRVFQFDTIEISVLIISGKISRKFSGKPLREFQSII